jgi:hypothetical protein
LSSADADASQEAIERVRARLSRTLGPGFDTATPPSASGTTLSAGRPLRRLSSRARGKWFAWLALAAVGLGVRYGSEYGLDAGSADAANLPATAAAAGNAKLPAIDTAAPPRGIATPEPALPAPSQAKLTPPLAALPLRPTPSAQKATSPRKGRPALRSKHPELGLAEELRQLAQARQALQNSPARALAEADLHEQRFPHGTLAPERELLRVEALRRLGRDAEARELAARMLAKPESQAYRAQVEELLSRAR